MHLSPVLARLGVTVLLTVGLGVPVPSLQAAPETATRTVAIMPFAGPVGGGEREWLSDGIPHVMALRLQQLSSLKVTALARSNLAGAEGMLSPLASPEISKSLERLRPLGYDVIIWGHFVQFEPTLRAEIYVWSLQPERSLGKTQEQTSERDPDGLSLKLAAFAASTLQMPFPDAELRRLAERYTGSADAFERFARALALAQAADDEEGATQAVALLREAVKFDGRFAMALRQQGDLLLRWGHYGSAAEAYQTALNVGRRGAGGYRLLGNAYFAQGEVTRALDAYKRGLQLDSRDAQLYVDLGLAHAASKDSANSIKAFLRALEAKPDDALAFANLGVVYLQQGNFPAATASLRRAQLLQGSDAVVSYNLGLSLMFEQAYDQAREQFEHALQLKSDFAAAAYQLALLYERIDRRQAIERWRTYLALAQKRPAEGEWIPTAVAHLQSLQQP